MTCSEKDTSLKDVFLGQTRLNDSKHFLFMPVYFHFSEYLLDPASVIDDKSAPFNPHNFPAVHVFLFHYTVKPAYFLIFV